MSAFSISTMNDDFKWKVLQARVHRSQTLDVYQRLAARGIECIVLKGVAIARFYPPDQPRISVDIDLSVAPENYEETMSLCERGDLGANLIDVHSGFRHLDTQEWSEIFEKTETLALEEGSIRVLSEEDQLRMICVHWLTDGGEREDRLWDIHYLIKKRKPDFDWDYFFESNGPLRRRWLVSAIGLAHKYTGLEIDDLPHPGEYEDLPEWVVRTVESRWADDIKFAPIDLYLKDPLMFMRQLRRRFPPNALMATIALEGDFDKGARLPVQLRYIIKRALPSFRRSMRTLWNLRTK